MRVLVVEDESKLAGLLARGLVEEGYAVDVTASAPEAVWYATEHEYDVVLLDLGLRDGDGVDVLGRLRSEGRWAPVIVVTARDDVRDRVAVLDLGADDYVTKPVVFDELLARIRAVVRRGRPPRPTVVSVGGLVLDPATRSVARHGEPVDLTAKEFALLEYLMRHPDRVLGRAELIEHVWDFAFSGDARIVDVYVRYLRRKVDEPFGVASIDAECASAIAAASPIVHERPDVHIREHSLEMQLPFLAHLAPTTPIVPLLMGYQTAETAAALGDALATAVQGRRALLIASTDLSHYHDAKAASALDRIVIDCVGRFDADGLQAALTATPEHACGGGPMVAVMRAARGAGARDARILNYADSGDVSGDKSSVVGYLAAALGRFDQRATTGDTVDTEVQS